jgi:hypothetical protein
MKLFLSSGFGTSKINEMKFTLIRVETWELLRNSLHTCEDTSNFYNTSMIGFHIQIDVFIPRKNDPCAKT